MNVLPPASSAAPRSIADVLEDADAALQSGAGVTAEVWPTGFSPLDLHLDGGLRAGNLILLGGPPGLGKTTLALQIARNMAAEGKHCIYLCYEHSEEYVLERLLAMESGLASGPAGLSLVQIRRLLREDAEGKRGLAERVLEDETAALALKQLTAYAERLHVVPANGSLTGLAEIREMAASLAHQEPAIIVDYLQKVHLPGERWYESEMVTRIAEGLKDLALDRNVPLLALVAADTAGIGGGRTRLHHLRGSTALAYEADVVLMLNEKYGIVARHHLTYDPAGAERFRDYVVCSIEKNRSGEDDIDMEFRKRLAHAHFETHGAMVREQLIDGRIFTD